MTICFYWIQNQDWDTPDKHEQFWKGQGGNDKHCVQIRPEFYY